MRIALLASIFGALATAKADVDDDLVAQKQKLYNDLSKNSPELKKEGLNAPLTAKDSLDIMKAENTEQLIKHDQMVKDS